MASPPKTPEMLYQPHESMREDALLTGPLESTNEPYAVFMALKFLMTWFVANMRHPMPWFNLKVPN